MKFIAYVSILAGIHFSCAQGNTNEIKEILVEHGSAACFSSSLDDTLSFTSGIRSILNDSKGNYWLGSHNEGVAMYDGESFRYFTVEDGLSNNQVRSIQEDADGVIWFGTAEGVCSFERNEIKQHKFELKKQGGPGENIIEKVKLTDLWFNAGNLSGFYAFDGEKLNFQPFYRPIDEKSPFNFTVTGFSKERADYGWIASYGAVFGYDGEAYKAIDDQFLSFYEGIGGNLHIRSVLEDSKGDLWIGNNGIGVLLYDGNKVVNFSNEKGLINAETSGGDRSPAGTLEHVFAIFEDEDGVIWFGDRDTGVWCFDGKKMKNFTVDPELESQMVWEIYQDANGELLFAMDCSRVYAFNGKSFERRF